MGFNSAFKGLSQKSVIAFFSCVMTSAIDRDYILHQTSIIKLCKKF